MVTFTTTGFSETEIAFMIDTLNDKRSWGPKYVHVAKNSNHEIATHKLPSEKINSLFPEHLHLHGLSVCDRRSHPIQIYICKENWESIPLASGYKKLNEYRKYLIIHEFGHALGHGHESCPGKNLPAPVMMQQTKGTAECYPDPWAKK
jgi:hypothetical protein